MAGNVDSVTIRVPYKNLKQAGVEESHHRIEHNSRAPNGNSDFPTSSTPSESQHLEDFYSRRLLLHTPLYNSPATASPLAADAAATLDGNNTLSLSPLSSAAICRNSNNAEVLDHDLVSLSKKEGRGEFPIVPIISLIPAANLLATDAAKAIDMKNAMEGAIYTMADGGLGDWFGGFLYSAGQQANEAVQDQLSALSFTSCVLLFTVWQFGACLVTSFSPCTLSVLPLTLGYIGAFGSGKCGAQVIWNSVAFSLGLATTLAILGIAASFAGKAYGQVCKHIWLASPCSTHVLATLLGYVATSKDPVIRGRLLLTYTTGYVAPLLLAASFAGALQRLFSFRKFSAWINPTRALLFGGGVYTLLDRLFPITMAM